MEIFNVPNISVGNKSNEENIQAIKGWINSSSETLNVYLTSMQNKIEALESEINKLKGEK